jgi:hypothetical protein
MMLLSYSQQHHLLRHLGLLLTLPILHHPRLLLGTSQRNEEALHMVDEQSQRSKKPSRFLSHLISFTSFSWFAHWN